MSRGSMSRDDMQGFLQRALSSFNDRDSLSDPHERLIVSLRAKRRATAQELAVRLLSAVLLHDSA
jgi:hypothetical protein